MADDYLQSLLDRMGAYTDPTQYPKTVFDPTATDDENKKKKLPAWAQQAGVIASQLGPDQGPAINIPQILANPANPAYGDNPMASQLTKQMVAAQAAKQQPPEPPLWTGSNLDPHAVKPPESAQPFPTSPGPDDMVPNIPARPKKDEVNPDPLTNPPGGAPQAGREVTGEPQPRKDDPGALPPGSQPTAFQPPGAQQAGMLPSTGFGGIMGKILGGLGQHSNLLLAMGAGLMGAPNVWQGLGRGFAFAGPAAAQDLKTQQMYGEQAAVNNLLRGMGAPPELAAAAALDPDVKKQALQNYVTDKGYQLKTITTTNGWGEKEEHVIAIRGNDPRDAIDVATGQPLYGGQGGAGGGGGGGGGGLQPLGQQQSQFYAPGVTDQNVNQNLQGEDYLNQFSPEVKAAVAARISGMAAPARSNFGKDVTKRINMIAQKYEQDVTGMPIDESLYPQRNKYALSLATPQSGIGLQKKGFQQGYEHFAKLSDALVKMKLSNGFLGNEDIAEAINRLKAHGVNQAGLIGYANTTGQALAGEMGNLFSKTGGGVHERQQTKDAVSNAFKSGKSAAGALEGVVDLIDGGLTTMENERNELFPDARFRPRGAEFNGPRQKELREHILHNIDILRGDVPRDQPGAPAQAQNIPPNSVVMMDKNGNIVSVKTPQQ